MLVMEVDAWNGEPLEGKGLTIQLDYVGRTDGQPVYVGFSPPGFATSDSYWKIMRLDYDVSGNLTARLWANSAARFQNVWDNRASYPYA